MIYDFTAKCVEQPVSSAPPVAFQHLTRLLECFSQASEVLSGATHKMGFWRTGKGKGRKGKGVKSVQKVLETMGREGKGKGVSRTLLWSLGLASRSIAHVFDLFCRDGVNCVA